MSWPGRAAGFVFDNLQAATSLSRLQQDLRIFNRIKDNPDPYLRRMVRRSSFSDLLCSCWLPCEENMDGGCKPLNSNSGWCPEVSISRSHLLLRVKFESCGC